MDKKPRGAPRKYNRKKVLEYIAIEMAKGNRCLEDICTDEGMPASENIYLWVLEDTDEGRDLFSIFSRAQQLWCWAQNDRIIKICDDDSRDILEDVKHVEKEDGTIAEYITRKSDNTAVNRDKLRITTRQWAMTKLASKHFGEKVTQEMTGAEGGPIKYEQVVDRPPRETAEEWQARVQRQLEDKAKTVIQ